MKRRRAFSGVASSAATRNDRGTPRKISEEEEEKEEEEVEEGGEEEEKEDEEEEDEDEEDEDEKDEVAMFCSHSVLSTDALNQTVCVPCISTPIGCSQ